MSKRNKPRRPGATVIARTVMGAPVGEPIHLDRRRRSLAAVVRRHADQRRPFLVSIHGPGDPLLPEDHTVRAPYRAGKYQGPTWSETLVQPGDTVLITYVPRGGGDANGQNNGKQIASALATIALMAVATIAAPAMVGAAAGALLPAGTMLSFGAFSAATSITTLGLVIEPTYQLEIWK